ncbi:MAG: SPFH domain-containing protein [Clostridia bacterium]|nr:SPFH domain-containing protein [Clostridia bacterium]
MGLIRAAAGAIGGVMADQWLEFINCEALSSDVLMQKGGVQADARSSNTRRSDNVITNGSKIVVNEGQCMLIVENGEVVDFCCEPGAYTYDQGSEPSLFSGGFRGLVESFKNIGKRFTFGGQPQHDQRVYYINTKEILDNKVGVGGVPFRDSEFGFTIQLKGYGSYSFRLTNPVLFYTNVAANVSDTYNTAMIEGQLKAEVQHTLQPVLGRLALKGIPYDQIPLHAKELADELNSDLTREWVEKRGISVVSVAFSSITPEEESVKKIAQFQESRVYTDPQMLGARIGAAQATAMESAASNQSGAMAGFVGMGFAQQAGGANVQELMSQTPQPAPSTAETWTCACGEINGGKYCSACGSERPRQQEGWKCVCGHISSGKFCGECGKARPEAGTVCAKCGYTPPDPENPPKFCPECGESFGG